MKKENKSIKNQVTPISYPVSSLIYEVSQKEYEAELERSSKLDNKVGITLAFLGVFSTYIIKFFDFSVIVKAQTVPCSYLHILKITCIILQILIIIAYAVTIGLLLYTARATNYLHFDCEYFIDKKQLYLSTDMSSLEIKVAMRYMGAIIKNNETNDSRAKRFNRAVIMLGILILLCIIAETLQINFFKLGVES